MLYIFMKNGAEASLNFYCLTWYVDNEGYNHR